MEGYDDIKNGIAYNGDLPSVDEPIEYTISGADKIRKGQTETYTIQCLWRFYNSKVFSSWGN